MIGTAGKRGAIFGLLVLGCTPRLQPVHVPEPARVSSTAARDFAWTQGAVVYGVVPSLFGKPPLAAVTERIDALANLGVDALWISPVTATTGPDDFGDAVTNYFAVRPDYGTELDMRALIERAHAHGIRVLLDFVPNHTSRQHPWFSDPRRTNWYERGSDGSAAYYFEWSHMPNLDYDNPDVVAAITGAFSYWLREFDVDGFRVDAAWGIQQRNPEVWPVIVADLREVDPEVYLLAEATARDPYWFSHGFDAAYDWTDRLGQWAWSEAFDDLQHIGPRLDAALAPTEATAHRVARFLNNNDTGVRFITRHGPAVTRVAAALSLTLPGVPIIYTGDEVGAEFEPYEPHQPIAWTDPHDLHSYYQRLVHLREALPGLRSTAWTRVRTEPAHAYAFVRHRDDGRDPVLVVLNFGPASDVHVTFAAPPDPLKNGPTSWDALHETAITVRWPTPTTIAIAMPPTTAMILAPRGRELQ